MQALSTSILLLSLVAPVADGWLGIYLDTERDEAVVAEVIAGSPAEKAGLRAGDLILAIDDKATPTRDKLVAEIRARKAGDTVRLKVRRDKQEIVLRCTLAEHPPAAGEPPVAVETPKKPPAPVTEVRPVAPKQPYLGLSVRETDRGVTVDGVRDDGPARAAGLAVGDVITQFDDTRIQTLADLDRALEGKRPGQAVSISVRNNRGVSMRTITLGERAGQVAPQPVPPPHDVPGPQPPKQIAPPARPPESGHERGEDRPGAGRGERNLEEEVADLRRQLAELRRELEELRRRVRE